jgi:transposase
LADFSGITSPAIDETSRARGHAYGTLAADAQARRVIFVTEGRDAKTIEALLPISWLTAACQSR